VKFLIGRDDNQSFASFRDEQRIVVRNEKIVTVRREDDKRLEWRGITGLAYCFERHARILLQILS
jgi:hypothetical protein